MIDTNLLKSDPKKIAKQLISRNYQLDIQQYESLEKKRKKHQTETEELQARRNLLSKEYGALKKEGTEDKTLNKKIEILKKDLDNCSKKLADIQSSLKDFLLDIPNIPADSTPIGKSEEDNIKIRDFGKPNISGGKDHLDITSLINIDVGNILAGSRFAVLIGKIAKLHRALICFMLDKAAEHGYEEYYLPMIAITQ